MGFQILQGDCRETLKSLADGSVNCCVTSPPYFGLRDYGVDGQIGLEGTPAQFVDQMVMVFREVRRVLRDDGTLWLNLGDSYCGYKGKNYGKTKGNLTARTPEAGVDTSIDVGTPQTTGMKGKSLLGIPWRVAFALQEDGWYLRQDIIWEKPNPMPESIRDRCTKAHEYVFLLSKSARYYFDCQAIREPLVTCDNRRPYGSQGAWDIDGRDLSKRPSGKPCSSGNKTHKYVSEYQASDSEEHRTKAGLLKVADKPWEWRNKRSVWRVPTKPFKGAHFATFPPNLVKPCILAGCPVGGVVLDPFGGSGTTGRVAIDLGRNAILCELNPDYISMIEERCSAPPEAPKKKRAKAIVCKGKPQKNLFD